jgi:hypothetical protein
MVSQHRVSAAMSGGTLWSLGRASHLGRIEQFVNVATFFSFSFDHNV